MLAVFCAVFEYQDMSVRKAETIIDLKGCKMSHMSMITQVKNYIRMVKNAEVDIYVEVKTYVC
jgi:hypothetical protein